MKTLNYIQSNLDNIRALFKSTHQENTLANTFIFSATDGQKRAKVATFIEDLSSVSDDVFLAKISEKMTACQKHFEQPIKWVRLEWVTDSTAHFWGDFKKTLKHYKRNYFRSGIAFEGKREPWLLLTEGELNSYLSLYVNAETTEAGVNQKNLESCIKARHGSSQMPNFADDMPIQVFKTAGLFFDLELNETHKLSTAPRMQGRRDMVALSSESVTDLVKKITTYLGNQVTETGLYEYGFFPCFDRPIGTYNTLRHASSTYALIEGYELSAHKGMAKAELKKIQNQIELALDYLEEKLIRHYPENKAYVVEINNEIKLGANAVAILALMKYLQVFPRGRKKRYLDLAEKLANGIVDMQREDGGFVHILDAKNLKVLAQQRVIYYDGEAAFGLMRLYGVTKDPRWINCVEKAFDYFIKAGHANVHDHWLSYCSNELAIYKPERKYFEFAVNNVRGFVNFIRNRITTYPTLLELCMAFHKCLLKLDEYPEFYDVLEGFDVADFYEALHRRANYLLNGVFFPEMAMHFKNPQKNEYGCFIRHHSFRVRIDDVEHYLSGYVAYQAFLESGTYPKSMDKKVYQAVLKAQGFAKEENVDALTPEGLVSATGGTWYIKPNEDWKATGLSIYPKSFQKGHIVVARSKHSDKGFLPPVAVKSFVLKGASAIVADDPEVYSDYGVPVLKVQHTRKATIDIGIWARKQFEGSVYGVTGSAGKTTTVAMLAHTLSAFGETGQTLGSANLPIGIAWNLACLPQTAKHWVLEMAIGNMSLNSEMVQPEAAIITNIAPAHLEYHKTVDMIAVKKARIFEYMNPNSLAVICRDIEQFDIIADIAAEHQQKIVSYGEHPEADIRLLSYKQGNAEIQLNGKIYKLALSAQGKHNALNAMAILAIIAHKGLDIEKAISQLNAFQAVSGRGEVFETKYANKAVTIYDQAYNANPLSMKAAFDAFDEANVDKSQKLLIIGDMLELGEDSEKYHVDVARLIEKMAVRETIFVGDKSKLSADFLAEKGLVVHHFENVTALRNCLAEIIKANDHILVKASNGVGLGSLFEKSEK